MKETKNYFVATIKKELTQIELERNSETERMINDALERIKTLETEYELLTLELKESSEDRRIIYAMISNFQNRIDILQNLLERIETVKELKKQHDENYQISHSNDDISVCRALDAGCTSPDQQ